MIPKWIYPIKMINLFLNHMIPYGKMNQSQYKQMLNKLILQNKPKTIIISIDSSNWSTKNSAIINSILNKRNKKL